MLGLSGANVKIIISGNARPRAADVAFFALAGLAAIILGMLAGSLVEYISRYTPHALAACETAWTILRSYILTGPALTPIIILALILFASSLVLLRQLYATKRLVGEARRRRVDLPQRLLESANALGLAEQVDLIADERVYSFCYGLLSPRICLTTGLLNLLEDDELDALLLHEQYHLQCRDPLKVLLSRTWASGLFFLPLAQDLRDRYMRAKEIEADVFTASETHRQMPLASALLKVLTSRQRREHQPLAAIGGFALNVTEERIEWLVNRGPLPLSRRIKWGRALTSALVVSLIVIASAMPLVAQPNVEVHNECTSYVSYNSGIE